jgi:hypothetical protein
VAATPPADSLKPMGAGPARHRHRACHVGPYSSGTPGGSTGSARTGRHDLAYLASSRGGDGRHRWKVTQSASAALRTAVKWRASPFLADREAVLADVFHLHLHVFPRYHGDSSNRDASWSQKPPRAELGHHVAGQLGGAYDRFWAGIPIQAP